MNDLRTIDLKFKYTEAVAVQASLEIAKSISKSFTVLPWFGALALVTTLCVPLMFHIALSDLFLPVFFGVFMLTLPYLTARKIRRNFKNNPNANRIISYQANQKGVRIQAEGSDVRYDWDRLMKVVERKAGFLLFVQTRLAHWIPKAAFEDKREITEFRNLVRSRGVRFIS